MRMAEEEIKVDTWNVQTVMSPGKLELLRKEMDNYRCNLLGLAEVRWKGQKK